MAGLGYQAVQPANFDMTDIVQRQQAMDIQEGRMRAYNESKNQPKYNETKLTAPHSIHFQAVADATSQLFERKREIDKITDRREKAAAVAEWNADKEELALFTQASAKWGSEYDQIRKNVKQNEEKYIGESLESFYSYPQQYQENVPLSAVNGRLYVGDTPLSKAGVNVFGDIPMPKKVSESFYENFIKTFNRSSFDKEVGSYVNFDKDSFDQQFAILREESAKRGIPQDQIDQSYGALLNYYQHDPSLRWKPDSDGGGKKTYGGFSFDSTLDAKERQMVDAISKSGEAVDGVLFVNTKGLKTPYTVTYEQPDGSMKRSYGYVERVDLNENGVVNVVVKEAENAQVLDLGNGEFEIKNATNWKTKEIKGEEARNVVLNAFNDRWQQALPQIDFSKKSTQQQTTTEQTQGEYEGEVPI